MRGEREAETEKEKESQRTRERAINVREINNYILINIFKYMVRSKVKYLTLQ